MNGANQSEITIVGGGIAGLALSLNLHARAIPCRVYEAAPELREIGVGITVLPHAIGSRNPLKMAVVFADFRAVSGPGNLPLTLMTTVLAPLGRLFGYDGWYKALTS